MLFRFINVFIGVLIASAITSNGAQTLRLSKREVQLSGNLGPISGSLSAGGSSSSSSNGGSSPSSSSSSSSLSSSASLSTSSSTLSSGSSGSSGGGSSKGGSLQASGSLSTQSGGSSGGSGGMSSSASASLSLANSTPKPEGLLSKMKDIIKEGKEMVKSSVDNLKKDDKSSISSSSSTGSISGGSGGGSISGSVQASGSSGSSSSSGGASVSAGASIQTSGGSQKSEGLLDKLGDMAKRGKEAVKETVKETTNTVKETAKNIKEDIKSAVKVEGSSSSGGGSASAAGSASVSGNVGGVSGSASVQLGSGGKSEGAVDKVAKLVNKGTEAVRDTVQKIEDKASEVTDKVVKTFDENVRQPMKDVAGSGHETSEGKLMASASVNAQMKPSDRDKYLVEVKKKQDSEMGKRPSSLREIISDAKQRGVIPKNEDRSSLRGNHADEKSMTVDVLDKMHEIAKIPVESALKPLDKALGYEKDPLIRAYDNTHELLRRPISALAKPVESMFTGAFKTSDESRLENEKLLQQTSEQERREARLVEEKARREDRSVVGSIADKTVALYEKPIEIILKPVDKMLGINKDGKKNPLLQLIDEIYNMSKKPVDALAKPFETILKKMADGEQAYQVSVRFNAQALKEVGNDPKLMTRLADGALNIADRMLTKPLEVVMKPLNHALGYDEPGKKNPIVDAAHSLKNATKLGVELFTKPIDRIIKEIADIGLVRDEAELELRRQEASRLVRALDKLHELAQSPFEIVLKPMSKALGYGKEGKREPLLRAWDIVHQVVRTPIQVIEKPIEEAMLGPAPKRPMRTGASIGGQVGGIKAGASVSVGGANGAVSVNAQMQEKKKNFIVDGIRKLEKLASKPLDVVTSPIRKMILGEDDERNGGDLDKNNRAIQARAQAGDSNAMSKAGPVGKGPDKIVKTIESMNNVVLKPIEALTQPIADMISPEAGKKVEVKAQVQASAGQQQQQPQQQQQHQQQQQQQHQAANAGGSINIGGTKISAAAQVKKN